MLTDQMADWPASEILAAKNGLLHLPSSTLLLPTARFFNVNALDYAYDGGAPERGWALAGSLRGIRSRPRGGGPAWLGRDGTAEAFRRPRRGSRGAKGLNAPGREAQDAGYFLTAGVTSEVRPYYGVQS